MLIVTYMYSINYSCKNTFGIKKVPPSKVESYLEVNTWADWRQQDLISDCGQGLAYWTQALHWTHSYVAIDCKVKLDQLIFFQPYPVTNFIFQKINKRTWNSQLFVIWPPFLSGTIYKQKGNQMINNWEFHVLLLIFWNMKFVTGYGWKQISWSNLTLQTIAA